MPADLVVVLPGILGSTLSKDGRLVWAPSAGSVLRAIGTFGTSVTRLRLPAGIGDDHPYDGVEPVGLMPDLHVLPGIWTAVKGYDKLLERLRSLGYREPGASPGNLIAVPYDWRLSCRYNGRRLGTIVEPALERWRAPGGPFAGARVVFVCHSMGGLIARWYMERCGGAEITRKLITLGTPYRGAARALAQLVNGADPGLGPFRLHLTDFARSMPSLHQLMPEYACIDQGGDLAKTTTVALPELDPAMGSRRDALLYGVAGGRGRAAAEPCRHPCHRGHQSADRHYRAAHRGSRRVARQVPGAGSVRRLDGPAHRRVPAGERVEARALRPSREPITASVGGLPPGAYSIDVGGAEPGTSLASVSSDILVWEDPNRP